MLPDKGRPGGRDAGDVPDDVALDDKEAAPPREDGATPVMLPPLVPPSVAGRPAARGPHTDVFFLVLEPKWKNLRHPKDN